MTSRERMLAAMACEPVDYTPCSFMIFFNLYKQCSSEREIVDRQLDYGLDAFAHAGHLLHSLHPEAQYREWVEEADGETIFCRHIDTPKGPLTARVRQRDGWPQEGDFHLFNDYVVTRSEEFLVKPEQDLEKLPYVFGPFTDESIDKLKASAAEAKRLADEHSVLLMGGWKTNCANVGRSDSGVMGCDAMAWLSGFEEVMLLSMTQPDVVKEYVDIIHRWNMRQIEIYLDVTGADAIFRRGWYETTEFWTPERYREIVAPVLKREVDLVHQAGRKFAYIVTSAFLPVIDDLLDTGIDVLVGLDPDQGKGTELAVVKQKFAERGQALWGGVSGPMSIERGTEADTRAAVKAALETLGQGGGFILSPVDNVRDDTENAWRNTQVFVDAWKEFREG